MLVQMHGQIKLTVTGSRRATLPTSGNKPSIAAAAMFAANTVVASRRINERDTIIIALRFAGSRLL